MSKALFILWYHREGGVEIRAQGVNFPALTLSGLETIVPRTKSNFLNGDND